MPSERWLPDFRASSTTDESVHLVGLGVLGPGAEGSYTKGMRMADLSIIRKAQEAFFVTLDGYTLADVTRPRSALAALLDRSAL